MSAGITQTFIKKVKREAKSIKIDRDISHSKALEIASNRAGFPTYHALLKRYQNQDKAVFDFIQDIREGLERFIKSDYGVSIIDNHSDMLHRHLHSENIHDRVLSKILNVYDNGVISCENLNGDWAIVNWAIDKETIKKNGHRYISMETNHHKVKGALLVSLGHFFRSAADCYESRRLIHPNFKTYLADWVRSVSIMGQKDQQLLLEMFPANKANKIASRTSPNIS